MKPFTIFLALICLATAALADTPQPAANPVCLMKTSAGNIQIELFADETPKTVKNFIALAEGNKQFTDVATGRQVKRPFFDGLTFHRVIKNFMIQGGCPKGDGTGDPGYRFEDEINADSLGLDKIKALQADGQPHPYLMVRSNQDYMRNIVIPLARSMGIRSQEAFESRKDEMMERLSALSVKECLENQGYRYMSDRPSHPPVRGVIAMANSGPATNGSQFFINLVDTPWLTGKHTVFGKVVAGMEVVDSIGSVPVDSASKPLKPVRIISITQLKPKPGK